MTYPTELIDLLRHRGLIDKVWVNADATSWHTHEVPNFKEVTREEILKPKTTAKNGVK